MNAGLIFVLSFCFGFFVFTSIAVFVTRGRRRKLLQSRVNNAPVVVTSATHTAPGGYPVTQTTMPASYQTNVYTAPYPPQMAAPPQMHVQMPMPMPMPATQPPAPGMQPYPYAAPYPPMNTGQGVPASSMNPPSYDMAVGQPSNYEKQAPYNPSFTAH